MEIFNNTTKVVKDDLIKLIQSGSRVSIAAACFSIYAYQELKKQLESCEELRFIFTSPTFIAEKKKKNGASFIFRDYSAKRVSTALSLRYDCVMN